jgi:hypothetical protein
MKLFQSGSVLIARYAACGLGALLLCLGTVQSALAKGFIDYLYVEANEGDSSGGHVALRFGDKTFHFQHETPGILRIRRIASTAFSHAYAMLGNRAIRESRIAVDDDTYDLLQDSFNRLFLIQTAQLEIRDSLHRDALLFELLLKNSDSTPGRGATVSLPLRGLGYFVSDKAETLQAGLAARDDTLRSPALMSLRNRILAAHGGRFIAERRNQAHATLRKMELRAAEPSVSQIVPDVYPVFNSTASASYEGALYILKALELLQSAPALRPEALRRSDSTAFELKPSDILVLQAFADRLGGDLANLISSSRTDWGFPFIVGMARLAAIEASCASGRLVFLDVLSDAGLLSPREDASLRQYLPAMAHDRNAVFLLRRQDIFSANRMREADYAALERSGNLLIDVEQAQASGSALRKDTITYIPSREVRLNLPLPDKRDTAYLKQQLTAAQSVEQNYAAALERLYAYDLVRRNCVTELFAVINRAIAQQAPMQTGTVNSSVAEPAAAVRTASEHRLGGFVDASDGLSFIPFVSAENVASTYTVIENHEQKSYRTIRLTEMKRHEAPLTVALRESNTITSTIYRPGAEDSKFLFFTDDTLLFRPLFGAFNLLVGVGESLTGIATLPTEGTDRLIAGARGILFSLPELFFVNIRKGSMAYVEHMPVPPSGRPDAR